MSLISYNKQLILDGIPQTLMFAEFHYYRTPKEQWEDRIKLIVEAGFHGIAAYIPWLIHEEFEGDFDFNGRKRGEHDLIGFIDLLEKHNLYFIPRPGPFIMAEMKNDGIPYWVYQKYPHISPITWDNKPGTTVTVDYLDTDFLNVSKAYYQQIIPILVNKLYPKGNVVALQLDNEIGMLSWVSNNPELNKPVIKSFISFLERNYDQPSIRYPFLKLDTDQIIEYIRIPKADYINQLHLDLGYFFRERIDIYVEFLKNTAIDLGFNQNLFIINIHGCSAGRTMMYPIGISQLYKSYYGKKNVISGSDVYISGFDVPQFHDSYMANILTDATNDENQALTSLEFSAGTGDYGNNFSQRYKTSRIDFLTRTFVALGNRLLNFYSFVGGTNYRLDYSLSDGNDRIASTGEAHGFAAPISPDGTKSYVFDRTKNVVQLMRSHGLSLAKQKPIYDNITYGFIPDYFMTEFHYPGLEPKIHRSLQQFRTGGAWDVVVKTLLLLNYNMNATNLDMFNPDPNKILILPSAEYMSQQVQKRIVTFLQKGGKLLLYGQVPRFDLEGKPCQLLADYLELEFIRDYEHKGYRFRTSIVAMNHAKGRPELHRSYFQTWKSKDEKDVLFKVYHLNEACGFYLKDKNSIIITTDYRSDLELFDTFMNLLKAKKNITHTDIPYHGVFMIQTEDEHQTSYLHIINMDDFDKSFDVNAKYIKDLPIYIEGNSALLLAFNLPINAFTKVISSTNEIFKFNEDSITVKLNGPRMKLVLETTQTVDMNDKTVKITKENNLTIIEKDSRLYSESELVIQLKN
ncbi:MAG: beta-galactosidase [Firmicutes bacterium]|nr:beta-galactosidase [Bacillota bacterium]